MRRLALSRGWRVGLREPEPEPHASAQTPPGSHLGLQAFFELAGLGIVESVTLGLFSFHIRYDKHLTRH